MKKGQVMVFVLFGIFLLIGVLVVIGTITSKGDSAVSQNSNTQNFIDMCFTATAECGLHRIGANSGSLGFSYTIPDLQTIEQTATTYIDTTVQKCFGNFTQAHGQTVVVDSINPSILLSDTSRVSAEPKITIQEGKSTTHANSYHEIFDIPFRDMYNNAVQLKSGARPEGVPDSYLKLESDFDVSVTQKEGKKLVSIAGGTLKKKDFRFNFMK